MSGLSRTPGKRVRVNSPPRVRIPPAPPKSLKAPAFVQGLFAFQGQCMPIRRMTPKSKSCDHAVLRHSTETQPCRWVHDLAIDSKSTLFAGEVDNGKRVQKFLRAR
jgi:hypothetical protein